MNTMAIAIPSCTGGNDADPTAARRLLLDIHERLENISCDVMSFVRVLDRQPGAVSELAADLLDDARGGEPAADTPIWEAPRIAYLLTAALADGDQAEAGALWKPLDKHGQADLLTALAAQVTVNLRAALSAAGTDTARYALAGALARMSADAAAARRIPQKVFAEMCRSSASR